MTRLDLDRIRDSVAHIAPEFLNSPQYECTALSEVTGCSVILKVETMNPIRSFKGRGVETVLARLQANEAEIRSVVCASAGNLGQALAYSGSRRNIPTQIVAATTVNPLKLERMKAFGATMHLIGDDIEAARVRAREIAEDDGVYLMEDSLDIATCEGAGTIGLELLDLADSIDVVLIALGGGAMASGIGLVMKSLAPEVEVIAIQPEEAPALGLSWRANRVINTETINTIADGVAGRFPIPEVLDDIQVLLDDVILVSEKSIKDGMRLLYQYGGLIVEPSAALGLASILENRARFAGKRVATIICGSNVVLDDFERWINE